MRVILLNQFFWPDSSATSQLLTDVARALAHRGHQVTAISSGAKGYFESGISADAPSVNNVKLGGVKFGRGKAGRVLSYASFYVAALWKVFTLEQHDLVVTLTTPPLISLIGTLVKLTQGTRHVIWEMDMYPEVATDLEYFQRHGFADRLTGSLADASRLRADNIIALGECMRDRLSARGVPSRQISVIHNWADGHAIQPLPRPGDSRELVLLYSGNLGLAHDTVTLNPVLISLGSDPRFRFLFVGGGKRRGELSELIMTYDLKHVHLLPYAARATLDESLAAGDIGVVTQREECCGSVVPSKVYGLLAAGRPILFIGPSAATPARIIDHFGCGWHIPVGESGRLESLLLHLASDREEVRRRGEAARRALDSHYDIRYGLDRIVRLFEAVGKLGSGLIQLSSSEFQPHQSGDQPVCMH